MAKKLLVPQLPTFTKKLALNIWYSGADLSRIWELNAERRSQVIQHLMKRDVIERTGVTANTRYRLIPEDMRVVVLKKTGNGVIDAKLRKEAGLPATTSSLENLITAATELGSDNEILRSKLIRIRAILDEV